MFQRCHRHQHLPFTPRVRRKMLAFRLLCLVHTLPLHTLPLHTLPLHPSVPVYPPPHPPALEMTLRRSRMPCGVGDRALRRREMVLTVRPRSPRQLEVLEKQAPRLLPPPPVLLDLSPVHHRRRRQALRLLHPPELPLVLRSVLRQPLRVLLQLRILPFLLVVAPTIPLQTVPRSLALLIVPC